MFKNPLTFVAFYNLGLPRFYRMPMGEALCAPSNETSISDEDAKGEVKMVSVMEIPEEEFAAFEAVIQPYGGRVVSSEQLDAMEI